MKRDPSLEPVSRPLPHSIETERAILGAILIDNGLMRQAEELLKTETFYIVSHQVIFEAMLELNKSGIEINPVTLIEPLRQMGKLHYVGGVGDIAGLSTGMPRIDHLDNYAALLREKAAKREIIRTCASISAAAWEEEDAAEVIAERGTNAMLQIERFGSAKSDFRPYSEIAEEAKVHYEQLHKGTSQAVPTGYHSLDKMTRGGLYPGETRVVMAKTGDGKSAWMIGAARVQAGLGIPVAIISLEMSDLENFARAHSALSGVAAWKIQAGIWPEDYHRLQDSIPQMAALPIYTASSSRMADVLEMKRQVREVVIKHKVRGLYVDYLQLAEVELDRKTSTRALEISTITRVLKLLAKELNIFVVELSQPSQEGAKSGKVRTIHNRESTAIGNDADIVIVIDMPEDRENLSEWECTMRIDKHRNGPKCALKYIYDGTTLTFSEPDSGFKRAATGGTERVRLDFNS